MQYFKYCIKPKVLTSLHSESLRGMKKNAAEVNQCAQQIKN